MDLKKRILDISYRHKLAHLGSCLTGVDIIDEIYETKKKDEKFILSSGHAGLALYCVIEKYDGLNAENAFTHHGVHPDRCEQCHIDCSAGSLGNGLPIAIGMALANQSKRVFCLISDGESNEGSVWESLRIAHDYNLTNLHVYLNLNGFGAYCEIDKQSLIKRIQSFQFPVKIYLTDVSQYPFLQGQDAHYKILTKEEYENIS